MNHGPYDPWANVRAMAKNEERRTRLAALYEVLAVLGEVLDDQHCGEEEGIRRCLRADRGREEGGKIDEHERTYRL